MKRILLIMMICASATLAVGAADNPFLEKYGTPFGAPPFDKIKEAHYMPAFLEGMRQEKAEIAAIVNNTEAPTLDNTIVALGDTGDQLSKVSRVFFNLQSADTNDEMQKIAREISPLLSRHGDEIIQNAKLFKRVEAVYKQKDKLNLTPLQKRLVEEVRKDFVRGGALLDAAKKKRLMAINEELSLLSVRFEEHVLNEDNGFELVIDKKADLIGLPERVVAKAAETAKERDHAGKWVFTLHRMSIYPFLDYSEKRDLRERIYKGYIERGNNGGKFDNKEIITKTTGLRIERANLLGYPTHSAFILDRQMAEKPERVYDLLDQVWKPALKRAKVEASDIQKMIDKEGGDFKVEPWDWRFYTEKIRKERYALEDAKLRPYFQLDNVRKGAFDVARRLFGITFTELSNIPVYHEDVRVFEVKEKDGSHIGLFYTDYYSRASKGGGAWCNSFRSQRFKDGKRVAPLVANTCNYTKPVGDAPALVSMEEARVLFHEFGHALHSLFSASPYRRLSGVPRDFVELPSQIMENWAFEPEVLRSYALHCETGEPLPDEWIERIHKARHFNQGFQTTEYVAASYLDMDWHTLTEPTTMEVNAFEKKSLARIGLIPEVVVRYRSPYFKHIFSGGYSSNYYGYLWAEVLDADAFSVFKQKGLFDQETAQSFRKNILSAGGTQQAMTLYKRFRGTEPKIDPLLERRGLK